MTIPDKELLARDTWKGRAAAYSHARRTTMRKTLAGIAIFGIAALTALLAADTAREQTLQRGIELMESKGDLAKAMPLFEEASKSADRAVAARALLYLGEAQERQGTDKARATYERIVKEFGAQTVTVAAAQKHLTALGGGRSSSTIAKRLLCSECGDSEADLSSDGRLEVFTDWDNNDLAIRDIAAGSVKRFFLKAADDKNDPFPETPILSPDGKQVAYLWYLDNKDDDVELRIIQTEPGHKPRTLLDKRQGTWFTLDSWFPDGKSFLVSIETKDHSVQLARVSVSDGAVTPLKPFGWRRSRGAWSRVWPSPDGKFIVYSARVANPAQYPPSATDPSDQHVYLLAADGSGETEIVKTSGINKNPMWTPDGKHVLFTSDRSGNMDLWAVAIQNGKPTGSETMVYREIGDVSAMGIRSGSYIFSARQPGTEYVRIADLKPDARATQTFVGIRPRWSPDGKSLAFKRRRPGAGPDAYDLVVHSVDTGAEKIYRLGTTGGGSPTWFHDSKSVMTGQGNLPNGAPPALYRIGVATGEFAPLTTIQGQNALSPDDKTLYVAPAREGNQGPVKIVAVDLATGQSRQVFASDHTNLSFGLSPDGRTLVLEWLESGSGSEVGLHLGLVSTDGGNFHELFAKRVPRTGNPGTVVWSNDGRSIYYTRIQTGKNPGYALMRLPTAGTPAESEVFTADGLGRLFDLSPDESRITYSSSNGSNDLAALDNVLALMK
jgi:Tol biopolymer transport system component